MALTYDSSQVNNLTINGSQQPGSLYVLNGGLNAFDSDGNQTIYAGKVPFTGTVSLSAFKITSASFPGWLPCDGGEYSCTDYPDLYTAIGNTFGSSNVNVTFKVPSITSGIPVSAGCYYIIKT